MHTLEPCEVVCIHYTYILSSPLAKPMLCMLQLRRVYNVTDQSQEVQILCSGGIAINICSLNLGLSTRAGLTELLEFSLTN